MTRALALLTLAVLGACSRPGGPYPSLAPRAAEAIDPRLPVEAPLNDRPADSTLAARLAALIAEARSNETEFATAIAAAERQAAAAGAVQSEGWIAAQQALSAAVAARAATARALGAIDSLGAERLRAQGGLAPNDLKAIEEAAATVGAIDARQQSRIAAVRERLGG